MIITVCNACGATMKEKVDECHICHSHDVEHKEAKDKSETEKKEDEFMKAAMEELDRYDEGTEKKDMKMSYRCPCEFHDHD